MPRELLTVLVPSFNSAEVIADCLQSAAWADELLVVDSGSTDETLELARQAGARLLQHAYENSAAQKNWAIPQAAHPWVLIVDTDERVTPELRREIEAVLSEPGPRAGYQIPRLNYAFGEPLRHTGYFPDYQIRLFRRDRGRYAPREVHAHMLIDGSVGRLSQPLIHYAQRSMAQTIRSLLVRMTEWEAVERERQGARASLGQMLLRPPAAFFYRYIYQGGFRDGQRGLVVSLLWSFYVGLTYLRLWERQHPQPAGWWVTDWQRRHASGR
jgi:glycosyltransferase involved in cell wall biosynthesis